MHSLVLAAAAPNYSPNSSFLCVTLPWSRVAPAQQRASTELPLETRDGSSLGRREPWQGSRTSKTQHRGNTTMPGDHCQLQQPAHAMLRRWKILQANLYR